jgi:ADP-ribose pyrophosphatase YjhB (NUDIX family)
MNQKQIKKKRLGVLEQDSVSDRPVGDSDISSKLRRIVEDDATFERVGGSAWQVYTHKRTTSGLGPELSLRRPFQQVEDLLKRMRKAHPMVVDGTARIFDPCDIEMSRGIGGKKIVIHGTNEKRQIVKMEVNPDILNSLFDSVCTCTTSFNLMITTTDTKVLLLERSQSFHFPKVVKDLKLNKININTLRSLYTSELERIRQLFFDFLPPFNRNVDEKIVHVFPGGHSNRNEPISKTLLRELQEETSMNINIQDLCFNESCIFHVLIYDCIINRYFKNFIFPVKINMNSENMHLQFKETKHTRNPKFIDVSQCKTLFEAFMLVQRLMIL